MHITNKKISFFFYFLLICVISIMLIGCSERKKRLEDVDVTTEIIYEDTEKKEELRINECESAEPSTEEYKLESATTYSDLEHLINEITSDTNRIMEQRK